MGNSIQLVCMGDKRQCIYEFKGADSRFLTMAPEIWSQSIRIKPTGFVHCTLKTSYRITNQMGKFINNAMIGEELMDTCRRRNSHPNNWYVYVEEEEKGEEEEKEL